MQVATTTVTQKGQVTIPAKIRRMLKLKRGDQVKFVVTSNEEVKVKPAKRSSIMSLYGSVKPKIKYKKTADIYKIIKKEEKAVEEAIAAEAANE